VFFFSMVAGGRFYVLSPVGVCGGVMTYEHNRVKLSDFAACAAFFTKAGGFALYSKKKYLR
jgi:glucose-6-phosphate isomerase